jgi:hypothetical protein
MVGPDFRLPPVETVTSTKSNHESKIISSVDKCRIKTKPFFVKIEMKQSKDIGTNTYLVSDGASA